MKTTLESEPNQSTLPKRDVLRRNVIDKLDKLTVQDLAAVHSILLRLEMDGLLQAIGEDIDEAEKHGRLTPEAVDKAIRQHRNEHPYGQ